MKKKEQCARCVQVGKMESEVHIGANRELGLFIHECLENSCGHQWTTPISDMEKQLIHDTTRESLREAQVAIRSAITCLKLDAPLDDADISDAFYSLVNAGIALKRILEK